jgi:hypothetical protein
MQVLSNEQRTMVFLKRGIFVPKNSRCCTDHLYRRQLTFEALKRIQRSQLDQLILNDADVKKLFEDCQSAMSRASSFDFDDPTSPDDQGYKTITGLSRGIILFLVEKSPAKINCLLACMSARWRTRKKRTTGLSKRGVS